MEDKEVRGTMSGVWEGSIFACFDVLCCALILGIGTGQDLQILTVGCFS